jgi:rhodanese-related sulfurtransferase
MPRYVSPEALLPLVGTPDLPTIVDVRRLEAVTASPRRLPAALWRDHRAAESWLSDVQPGRPVVVYCAHGHNVSEIAAASLREAGVDVAILSGGLDGWVKAGGPTVRNTITALEPGLPRASVWVTRQRPKIDRVACPWLIRRFVDPAAIFHFVAAEHVLAIAEETGWIPFDVEGVFYSHRGDQCTFDTLIEETGLSDPAAAHLARIVRGADTGRPDLEPQSAGLLAISLGLSAIEPDDRAQIEKGMLFYDALYGWCRKATGETHNWPSTRNVPQ